MSSDTTTTFLQTAYDRLMAYVDPAGRSLATYLGAGSAARLYVRLTPDAIQYPYVALRCSAETDPELANLRSHITIEAHCVGRADDGTTEQIADLVEGALLTWLEASAALGVTFGQTSRRETAEPLSDAANRDLTEATVWVTCVSWSKRLTSALA